MVPNLMFVYFFIIVLEVAVVSSYYIISFERIVDQTSIYFFI